MVFIRYPFDCGLKYFDIEEDLVLSNTIRNQIVSYLGCEDFLLYYNGKILHDEEIPNDSTVHVAFPLRGGKGGFGSMLRAIGAQIEKTTNREACRDLSGRRLRDINEEQRLKKWIAKEAEREAEKVKRRRARIERLKSKPAHKFFDFEYEKEISELPERVNDALYEGLQKKKQSSKRPLKKTEEAEPKKAWLSDDLPDSSSDSDSMDNNESSPKKPKVMSNDSSSCDSDSAYLSQFQPGSSKESPYSEQIENDVIVSSSSKESSHTEQSDIESNASHLQHDSINGGDKDNSCPENIHTCKSPSNNEVDNKEIESSANASHLEPDNISGEDKDKINSCSENMDICSTQKKDAECNGKSFMAGGDEKSKHEDLSNKERSLSANKEEMQNFPPIDLLEFRSVSDLEELGLERLKAALMAHGLKCGGNLSDRAQRLWKVRGLKPHEYPSSLLAKKKK